MLEDLISLEGLFDLTWLFKEAEGSSADVIVFGDAAFHHSEISLAAHNSQSAKSPGGRQFLLMSSLEV